MGPGFLQDVMKQVYEHCVKGNKDDDLRKLAEHLKVSPEGTFEEVRQRVHAKLTEDGVDMD